MEEVDVARELQKQGHKFCIAGVVFTDTLSQQAIDGYTVVDEWLDGEPEDINDVTLVSEEKFTRFLLHHDWILKTTSSHDPRVDEWPELRKKQLYNSVPLTAGPIATVRVPSVALVEEFVFDIMPKAPEPGEPNILEQVQGGVGLNNKDIEGIPDVPIFEPATTVIVSAGPGDRRFRLEKGFGGQDKNVPIEAKIRQSVGKNATVEDDLFGSDDGDLVSEFRGSYTLRK